MTTPSPEAMRLADVALDSVVSNIADSMTPSTREYVRSQAATAIDAAGLAEAVAILNGATGSGHDIDYRPSLAITAALAALRGEVKA